MAPKASDEVVFAEPRALADGARNRKQPAFAGIPSSVGYADTFSLPGEGSLAVPCT